MKTNTNEFKNIINAYLTEKLNDIDNELIPSKEVAKYSFERFKSEYNNDYNKRVIPGTQNRLREYLMGLPFHIAFANWEILELTKKWKQLPENATTKQEDKILGNYWNFMAFQILKFWQRNGLNINELY